MARRHSHSEAFLAKSQPHEQTDRHNRSEVCLARAQPHERTQLQTDKAIRGVSRESRAVVHPATAPRGVEPLLIRAKSIKLLAEMATLKTQCKRVLKGDSYAGYVNHKGIFRLGEGSCCRRRC